MKEGMNKLTRILEALIFASDRPLSLDRLTALVAEEGHGKAEIAQALRELRAEYVKRDGGISLEEVAGGYRFSTHEGSPMGEAPRHCACNAIESCRFGGLGHHRLSSTDHQDGDRPDSGC